MHSNNITNMDYKMKQDKLYSFEKTYAPGDIIYYDYGMMMEKNQFKAELETKLALPLGMRKPEAVPRLFSIGPQDLPISFASGGNLQIRNICSWAMIVKPFTYTESWVIVYGPMIDALSQTSEVVFYQNNSYMKVNCKLPGHVVLVDNKKYFLSNVS